MQCGVREVRRQEIVKDVVKCLVSQLCYGPVVIYCMVYHSTKKAMLARLLANESPAIYAVH